MADERRHHAADVPVTAEEVAHRGFSTSFRGFNPDEVRIYLTRGAESLRAARERQRELEQQMRELEQRAANPRIDEATLTSALGEHTARIIRSAHEAAADIRTKAEGSVEQILKDAHEEAAKLRADAERVLADRVTEAEAEANAIRQAAEADALGVRRRAQEQADRALERSRQQSKDMANEVQGLRNRVMSDLMRRRRSALMQVEQLQAGRDRLLEAYRVVRRTLDEATDSLERAEADARAAAEAAAHRVAAEPDPELGELTAETHTETLVSTVSSPVEEPAPEPEPIYSRPPDTISSVRLVRGDGPPADKGGADAEPEPVRPTLKIVQPPSDMESVRVFRGPMPAEPEPAEPEPVAEPAPEPVVEAVVEAVAEPEPEPVVEAVAEAVAEPEAAPEASPAVDELFAKIRAEQEEQPAAEADAEPEPAATEDASEEADLVARRDEVLGPVVATLTRKLKRAMQDEQNEVLDRLRRHRSGRVGIDVAFPEGVDQRGHYRGAAMPSLLEAMNAGAASVDASPPQPAADAVAEIAADMAEALVGPLARRLEQGLDEAAALGEDEGAISSRVSAIYRDIKGARIERIAADYAGSAYMAGAFVAWPQGTPLRWIVHDVDGHCPDCDDNALAGPTPRGEAFPTGQVRPPAHAGCRCLLAPASA